MIIKTRSTQHLFFDTNVATYQPTIKYFSDGEMYVNVSSALAQHDQIWVIASTQAPAEHILELLFLLDALAGISIEKINLVITYFGYARQAVAQPGNAHSAKLIAQWLQKFPLARVYIIHPHALNVLENFMPFTPLIPIDFFCNIAKNFDCIAAPDKGAADLARMIAQTGNKEIVLMEKTRSTSGNVATKIIQGNIRGKKILLVDDIISTGQTIIKAAQTLKEHGALSVSAAATHGIFCADALEHINASILETVHVTNTLSTPASGKVKVYDISQFIMSVLKI